MTTDPRALIAAWRDAEARAHPDFQFLAERAKFLLDGYASALDELDDLRNRVADVQREAGMQALVIEQQDRDSERLKKFESAVAQGFIDLGAANQQINRLTCDLTAARDMNRHLEQERDAWPLAYKQRAAQTDARIRELEGEVERIRAGMTELRAKLSAREDDDDDIGYWRDDIDAILQRRSPMHDDEVTKMPGRCQKCNNDPCRCPPPDPYRFGSTTATSCARCSHTFTSRTDGFVDEALEIEVAAHQERCFVAGDYVYVDTPTITGTGVVTGLVAPGLAAIKMDERGKHYEAGTRLAFGTCTLRRIPRPQQGDPISVQLAKREFERVTPVPVLYDGRTAESCYARWSDNRSIVERGGLPLYELTPDQIAEAKRQYASVAAVTWSRILRNLLAASAEADRCRVRVDDQSEP